ncbi:hypothetical protein L5515_016907 [Caenorhabditis briggsae]|uniref:Uncharacterized protein n=1 Tax=Caenorhabditis briggsae TaxID=6238 RepID=A0AAE9JQU6_CAEBR|nr:hypothetical protein L5515_016907 [Caenorhabditis briggsae]
MTSPMISPLEPSSNQLFSNMFDDEILQIAERYGAPNRLSPIAPWTSQCLAKFLASQNSPNSLTENQPTSSLQNQHSVFDFSPLEATSIQCFSEVPSPINISSNERLLDIVKQIDASSSERSPGTTKDEFSQTADRNIAPNHCSPIKCSPGQPSPVGLSPCKPFSPELSMFEFSPVKVQRLPDVFSPLKTTSSDNSSNSFCQSRLRLAAPMKKLGPALCCCLDVLSPTKPLSDQSFSDDNEPLPLQPSSTNCLPNHHSPSESLASQHLLSGLPNEDVRQVHAQNNPAIDRKKYGAPLRRKKMPDGSWKTLPWIKQKGYVEIPNSSNTIQRPSICFSPVKPLMSLCSSDWRETHFSSKPLPSFSSRPSPDCHLPLKPSPEKRSPNRLSSRKLLMIQRSKRRVYRQQLSSGLSDEGNRPVCEKNKTLVANNCIGAPLKRKRMPDGCWKTLPWIKKQQLSSLSSKPLPSLSSQPLCSDWSDEGNLLVCENKIVNARIKNMPLGRIKMADDTWKTLQCIKPKGYVPKFYNC